MKHVYSIWLLLALCPFSLISQISLTQQDLLNMIGSSYIQLEEENTNIPISPGEAGANQVWDYRSASIVDTIWIESEFLDPSDTPFGDQFPEANFVQKIQTEQEFESSFWGYHQINSSEFIELGSVGQVSMPFDTTIFEQRRDTVAFLPLTYQHTFTTVVHDTVDLGGGLFSTVSTDSTIYTVDGWGTLRLPSGDYECLRLRQDEFITTTELVNGIAISFDFESYIQYDWIGKENYFLASIQSQNGETNPNFNTAIGFGYLFAEGESQPVDTTMTDTTGMENPMDTTIMDTTGIDSMATPIRNQIEIASDVRVFPNPSSQGITVSFTLKERAEIRMSLLDISGRELTRLKKSLYAQGNHSQVFLEELLPPSPGMYLLKLQVGKQAIHQKFLRLP